MKVMSPLFSNFEMSKSGSINNSFSSITISLKEDQDKIKTRFFIEKCLDYAIYDEANRIEIFKQMGHYQPSQVLTNGCFKLIYE
jgi:hypothetical protein